MWQVLSVDLVWVPLRTHGVAMSILPICGGIATVFLLDVLVEWCGCVDQMGGGHGHSHGGGPMLPLSVREKEKEKDGKESPAAAARARSALLTALALAAHNAPEGLAVGMASLQAEDDEQIIVAAAEHFDDAEAAASAVAEANEANVILVVVAIALHNIPEGIAVAVALFNSSGRRAHSCMMSTCTGLVEPVSAVMAVLVLAPFLTQTTLDCSLMYVGGVMVTVSVRELGPEAWALDKKAAMLGGAGGCVMMAISILVFGA